MNRIYTCCCRARQEKDSIRPADTPSPWGETARYSVDESEYGPFIKRMIEALRELWNTANSWESLVVFEPLKDIAHDILEIGGIILLRQANGSLYVDVPYSEDTIPTQDVCPNPVLGMKPVKWDKP